VLRAFDDGKIFGEVYSDGPVAVVWLHGWGRRGADFTGVAGDLASTGVASVALDLPGFGSSPPPAVPGGARSYAGAVAPVLASLGPAPLVLVGHSFGGSVATVLAAQNPELVRSLVLTGAPLIRRDHRARAPLAFRLQRALHARGVLSEARMESARQRYGSADYRAARGVMRDVLVATVNESYEDEMSRVRVRARLLWGANDTEVPVADAERARGLFAGGATLRVLDGVAHWVPTEAPHELAADVREALA
jgi:pimeloyl-ACP methyl ester carboxylesterase